MTHKEILDELRQPVKDLRDHIPAVFDGYRALSSAALNDGADIRNGCLGWVSWLQSWPSPVAVSTAEELRRVTGHIADGLPHCCFGRRDRRFNGSDGVGGCW